MSTPNSIESFYELVNSLACQLRPANYRDLQIIATELWLKCPPYRQAIIRGTSMFMTEIEVIGKGATDAGIEEVKQARDMINKRFAATDQPTLVLQEAVGFGGACVYLQMPIRRILTHACGATMPVDNAMCDHGIKFDPEDGKYKGVCPACNKKRGDFTVTDMKEQDRAARSSLSRIPLSLCKMEHNPLTSSRELTLDCSKWDSLARGVRSGSPMFHAETPTIFIESVRQRREVRMSDKFFHYMGFPDASLIETQLDGWSLPPFFYAFNDVISVLLLQRYNNLILSEYVTPHRYIAPPPTVGVARQMGGGGPSFDPSHSSTGSYTEFAENVARTIGFMKTNPKKIGIFPYPVQFSYMGLDGKQLLAPELLQHHIDSLMWNMGIPSEFYRGGTQATVATPAMYAWTQHIRFWRPLANITLKMYQWVCDRLCESQRWGDMDARLVPPTAYQATELIPVLASRNAEGKLSDSTFDRILGVDTDYEQRTVMLETLARERKLKDVGREEERKDLVATMLSDAMPDMQALNGINASAMGVPPGGGGMPDMLGAAPAPLPGPPQVQPGAPPAPEGSPQAALNAVEQRTMEAAKAKAMPEAQRLVQTYPDAAERGAMLRTLTAQQPMFGMLVGQAISEIEADAEKQGRQAARGGGR